jgi:hypothetical protein
VGPIFTADGDVVRATSSTIRTRHNTPDLYRVVGILDQAKHDLLVL